MAKSLCIYGNTGSRKTTQAKWFSHYIAEVTGKSTLLLSLSDGGWSPMCDPEIEAGMIRPYKLELSVTPVLLLRKISQGFWPAFPEKINEAILDMASGGKADITQASLIPIDWSQIGGAVIEGWTSISEAIMRFLPDKGISVGGENRNQISRSGVSSSFNQVAVVNGEIVTESFGSNIWTDYGFVQKTLSGLVSNLNSLPFHTVLYTAMEGRSTEDGEKGGKPMYGPDIAGKKATAACGGWVGDLIHAQDYAVPAVVKVPDAVTGEPVDQTIIRETVRFFYRKHPDPDTGIMFPAKPRCAPEKILELEKVFPGGYYEPEFGATWGVDRYLREVDRLATDAKQNEGLKSWRDRADKLLGRGK